MYNLNLKHSKVNELSYVISTQLVTECQVKVTDTDT